MEHQQTSAECGMFSLSFQPSPKKFLAQLHATPPLSPELATPGASALSSRLVAVQASLLGEWPDVKTVTGRPQQQTVLVHEH